MTYCIDLAGFTIQGPFRQKNEDNLFLAGTFLPAAHGDSDILTARCTASEGVWAAVFDGVGGEAQGEVASFLAAGVLDEPDSLSADLNKVCLAMNRTVCEYAEQHQIRGMGTTVAALHFGEGGITGFNVGDSRCYRASGGQMERLSVDHARYAGSPQQRMLTQYVGIRESDFVIMPDTFEREYVNGDVYMLCTDGITDVIIDRRLKEILCADTTLPEKLCEIKARLESRGTPDNATVLLARIREKDL